MRTIAAALASLVCLAGLSCGLAPMPARGAARSPADGAPIATSFIYPVGSTDAQPSWDPNNANGYYVTQGFDTSCDPAAGQGYYLYGLYYCGHTGIDLATSTADAAIHATAAGVVVEAGYNGGGYGVMVRIRHLLPDGSLVYSQYEHMAYGSLAVYAGETVTQGQTVGLVGATGFATGAHLHFEIKSTDEDGFGYTFGNTSLIAGYLEPLGFVAVHLAFPTTFIPSTGPGHQVFPGESTAILAAFLKSYRHYVLVKVSDGLRVRSGPTAHAKVLGVALRGAKLGYLRTAGRWIEVALPQKVTGWVDRDYVAGYQDWDQLSRPAAHVTPLPKPVVAASAGVPAMVVNADVGLYVRSAPGQNHSVISSIFQGDRISILVRTPNWARVLTRDGTHGWVLLRYLARPGSHPSLASRAITATDTLHVRTGPGTRYAATGAVYRGTRMQLVRETPHWAAVILPGGTTGWVARPYTTDAPRTGLFAAASSVAPRASYLTVATDVLNVRAAPGQNHRVVAEVKQNTRMQLISLTTNWAHVALPASRIDGWVLRRLTR